MAIDPGRFAGADTLEATIDELIADLRTQGEILFPGEPELLEEARRKRTGIPIDDAAFTDMQAWSAKIGVPPLTAEKASA
jgi:ureidoglycolate dehydrogenase (NAD+)